MIITDLPFGINHVKKYFNDDSLKPSDNCIENFYLKILSEFNRLLVKSNGTLVVLINSNETEIFENVLNKIKLFEMILKNKLSLGKTNAILYKLIGIKN